MKNFFIVDVFAEEKYAGNQLAVVMNAKDLSSEEMQKIAREFNFSETTFILNEKDNPEHAFDVRIFTPYQEVPFAGHPTLGTAFIIHKHLIQNPVKKVLLNLKVGSIPVEINQNENQWILWMKQINPEFGKIYPREGVERFLGLNKSDLDEKFPIMDVSTGIKFLMIPLKNKTAVQKAKMNNDLYLKWLAGQEVLPVFIFCPEGEMQTSQIHSRMFADLFGIAEDPATGSANGCLAGYMILNKYFNLQSINIQVEQGFEMKRPSILYLKAHQDQDRIHIFVGGKVIPVAQGQLY